MGRGDLKAKIRLEGDASGATKAIKKTEKGFSGLASKLKAGAFAVVGALASLTGAFKLLEAAGERLGQKRALERTLKSQGLAIKDVVGELKDLANNQIATSDIIIASNRALALGIAADDLPGLLEAATKASVSLGISATQAFNDITTGVGRASPLILDNLGIVVDAVRIYKDYAEALGISTEELTKQQKTAALSAAVMQNAAKGAEDFAAAQSKVTVELAKSKTQLKEWFQNSIDAVAENENLADSIGRVTAEMNLFVAAARATVGTFLGLIPGQGKVSASLRKSIPLWRATTAGIAEAIAVTRSYGKEVLEVEAKQDKLRLGLIEADAAYDRVRESVEDLTRAQIDAEKRTKRIEASILAEATALDKLRAAIGEVTQAELQKELNEITLALEAARIETGGNTEAFKEMERKVVPTIDHMKRRIKGMADGLGDIGEAADDAGDSLDDFGDSADGAGRASGSAASSVDALGGSMDDVSVAARSTTETLRAQAAQAQITAGEFDNLSDSIGRTAAVAEALERGGSLTQGGTRLRLPGGGSRLVDDPGSSNISGYSLSQFGTGGRTARVDPSGNVGWY